MINLKPYYPVILLSLGLIMTSAYFTTKEALDEKQSNQEEAMFDKITMITLGVKDLQKSTEFYIKGLGLPQMPFDGDITFVKLQGTMLALFEINKLAADIGIENTKAGFSGFTLAHNVSSEAEVDKLYEKALAGGATPVTPPVKKDWGGYSAYFADPDGYYWEIAYNPFF